MVAVLQSLQGVRRRASKGSIEDAAWILWVSKRTVRPNRKEFWDALHDPEGMNLSRWGGSNSGRPKNNSAELMAKIQAVPHSVRASVQRIVMAVVEPPPLKRPPSINICGQ